MTERHTRVTKVQIKDVAPGDLDSTNSPSDGDIAEYESATQQFTWRSRLATTDVDDFAIKFTNDKITLADRVEQNIMLAFFKLSVLGGLSAYNLLDGLMDEFEDESGVDAASSTNESYDSSNDLYTPASAGLDSDTDLLLHCNGVDGSKSHAISFTGNAQIDTAQYKFGTSSLLLDGTGDYVTVADHDDWNFGSGNFAIELWVRWNSLPSSGNYQQITGQWNGGAANNKGWDLYIYNNGSNYTLYFTYSTDGSSDASVSTTISLSNDTWYHIACSRNSNDFRFFLDGTQQGSTQTLSATLYDSGASLSIGTIFTNGSPQEYLNGWVDEVRISKGDSRWTSSFTTETEKYTSDQYCALLCHFENTDGTTSTDDSSGGDEGYNVPPHIITFNGNAQLDTAQSKFGSSSLLLDGNDYLTLPDSNDWTFSSDFTIDFQARFNSLPTNGNSYWLVSHYQDASNNWEFYVYNNAGQYRLYFEQNTSPAISMYWNVSLSTSTWYHIALVRNSNTWYLFLDGTSQGTNANSNAISDISGSLWIGTRGSSTSDGLDGWLDEIRISSIARWTGNFTAPSSQYASSKDNMTLISESTAAEAAPDNARIVLFEEDIDAVTINTDIKAYISRDDGSNFTQCTLVDEGDYETGKRILSSAAVDISSQPSGTSIIWKVTTHNNKDLNLHGVGLNWD